MDEIQRSFDRAAPIYLQYAQAQEHIASTLWQLRPTQADCIVDLGCGPGHWTARLAQAYPQATIYGVDLSPQMLAQAEHCYPQLNWVHASATQLPFPDQSVDFVFSSLMLQWCQPALPVFQELKRILRPGGALCLSTLLPGSLLELERAWHFTAAPSRVRSFEAEDELASQLLSTELMALQSHIELEHFHFPEPRALLHSITKVGANAERSSRPLSRLTYRNLLAALEAQRTPAGIPLSYRVLYWKLTHASSPTEVPP